MDTREFKFKNGDSVRIIASGVTAKVINHRGDRDDNVNTLVEWTDKTSIRHEQWCRETELGSPSATDLEKAQEKATGVPTDTRADRNERADPADRTDRTDLRKTG